MVILVCSAKPLFIGDLRTGNNRLKTQKPCGYFKKPKNPIQIRILIRIWIYILIYVPFEFEKNCKRGLTF